MRLGSANKAHNNHQTSVPGNLLPSISFFIYIYNSTRNWRTRPADSARFTRSSRPTSPFPPWKRKRRRKMYNNGRFCADEGTKEWVKRWLNYSLDGLVFAASFTHDTRPKGSTSVFLCRAQREFRKKRQPPSLTTSYFRYDRSSSSSSSSFPLVDTFFLFFFTCCTSAPIADFVLFTTRPAWLVSNVRHRMKGGHQKNPVRFWLKKRKKNCTKKKRNFIVCCCWRRALVRPDTCIWGPAESTPV